MENINIEKIDGNMIKSKKSNNHNFKNSHYICKRRRKVMFDLSKNKFSSYEKKQIPKQKYFWQDEEIAHNRLKLTSKKTKEHFKVIENNAKSLLETKGK